MLASSPDLAWLHLVTRRRARPTSVLGVPSTFLCRLCACLVFCAAQAVARIFLQAAPDDRSRYEGADVLADLFGSFRNHIVGGRVQVSNDAMGKAFARSTPLAAVALRNHVMILLLAAPWRQVILWHSSRRTVAAGPCPRGARQSLCFGAVLRLRYGRAGLAPVPAFLSPARASRASATARCPSRPDRR